MITQREARQRLVLNGMALHCVDREFRVSFAEMNHPANEATAYYTDDLDDAVLTGASMRRRLSNLGRPGFIDEKASARA